jgi:hypothetical protein
MKVRIAGFFKNFEYIHYSLLNENYFFPTDWHISRICTNSLKSENGYLQLLKWFLGNLGNVSTNRKRVASTLFKRTW